MTVVIKMATKVKITQAGATTKKAIERAKKKEEEREALKNGREPGMKPEGFSNIGNVKLMNRKPIKINMDFEMPDFDAKLMDADCKEFRCSMCGKTYRTQRGNFISSTNSPLWKGNNGYTTFCKTCAENLMISFTRLYSGNEEHAIRHLCYIFDWYYSETISAMTRTQASTVPGRIPIYPAKANTVQGQKKRSTYVDTLKDEQELRDANLLTIVEDVQDVEEENDDFEITKEMVRAWGSGFSKEEYRYLETEYNDWITKNVCNTKSQEEIYRNIVLAQLDIRIARQRGGKVSEAQKALQDLMNSANILPRQNAENILADTQTFGTLLKKFEETDPIPEPDERWRDVDGIRKYMNTWFRGGLAKALKIKNENARLYEEAEEEFDKYTVAPAKINSAEQKPDSSIFDEEANAKAEDSNA